MSTTGLIYLIEDNVTVSNIIARVISSSTGLSVVEFLTGELMTQQLTFEKPDLIIVDYMLDTKNQGAMNGNDVLNYIRNTELDIPVILLTGITNEEKLKEFQKLDFDAIIHKDADNFFEVLMGTISKFIQSPSLTK